MSLEALTDEDLAARMKLLKQRQSELGKELNKAWREKKRRQRANKEQKGDDRG